MDFKEFKTRMEKKYQEIDKHYKDSGWPAEMKRPSDEVLLGTFLALTVVVDYELEEVKRQIEREDKIRRKRYEKQRT